VKFEAGEDGEIEEFDEDQGKKEVLADSSF